MTQENPTPPPQSTPLDYGTPTSVALPSTQDERNMGLLLYILAIVTGFIGPLILWLLKKDASPFLNDQGKEVLNFQITTFLAWIVCVILMFIVIGAFLMPIVFLCYLIFMIMGMLKAKDGIAYRFPICLRLLK